MSSPGNVCPMAVVRLCRIYDEVAPDDGVRVLADRLWPRGIRKDEAPVDHWAKELAPSDALRRQFHADGDVERFRAAYLAELDSSSEEARATITGHVRVTLVTSARDPEHGHLAVLRDFLEGADA